MEIQRKDPAPRRRAGPSTDLDQRIADQLRYSSSYMRPMDLARKLGVSTQDVHARLKVLVARDVVGKTKPDGSSANGPGSALYHLTEHGLDCLPETPTDQGSGPADPGV